MTILESISESLQNGRAKEVKDLVQQAIDQGMGARAILEDGLLAGMNVIGAKFKRNEVFVPEVLIAARAMNVGMVLLKPLLVTAGGPGDRQGGHRYRQGRPCTISARTSFA